MGSRGYLKVNAASGLTDIRVRNYLEIGTGHGGTGSIGDPANSYKLPGDVNLTLGEWGIARCDVEMSSRRAARPAAHTAPSRRRRRS